MDLPRMTTADDLAVPSQAVNLRTRIKTEEETENTRRYPKEQQAENNMKQKNRTSQRG